MDRADPGRRTTVRVGRASRLEPVAESSAPADPVTTAGVIAAVIMTLLLLICGSNAAALLLARGAARQREIAVRVALGAGRLHITRHIAVEVAVVALASAAAGVAVCIGTVRALSAVFPMPDLLRSIQPDTRVFAFAFGAATLVAVFFGFAPVRQAGRVNALSILKGEAVAFGRHLPALRLRRSLIAVQIAISAGLLVVAGLFGRSVAQALQAAPGYETAGLYVVQPDANWVPGESPRDGTTVRQRLVDVLSAVPGVTAIGYATLAPFSGTGHSRAALAPIDPPTRVHFNQVDTRFFGVLGVPVIAGRDFGLGDVDGAIVNAALARRFWGGEAEALGRVLFVPVIGEPDQAMHPVTVIGVIPTLQTTTLGMQDEPTYYTLLTQRHARTAFLVVRAAGGVPLPRLAADALRSADPDAVATITSIDERLLERTAPARVGAFVAGLIGLLALAVAAVGIHGVIAYTIACRTREIGLHQALGARPVQVLRVVFAWTLRGVAIGGVAGLGIVATAAVVLRGPLTDLFNGLHPLDPTAFAAGGGVLMVVVLAAIGLPARRAMSLSPLDALRRE
jgi:predicted permease